MKNNFLTKFMLLFSFFYIHGCLENPNEQLLITIEDGGELLYYLESNGDFINSGNAPLLVNAEEVYQNLGNYLVIDVRPTTLYKDGHIEGSVNVPNTELLEYFEENNTANYLKVVFVSATGQSAAYYTSLLTLLGYNNIYSLNFGIASWNNDFKNYWLFNLGTASTDLFTNKYFEKNNFSELPELSFESSSNKIADKLRERVNILLKEGFDESQSFGALHTSASINSTALLRDYNYGFVTTQPYFKTYYVICYGTESLYRSHRDYGHFYQTAFYKVNFDLRSTENLQTIPNDRPTVIYSFNGQTSAYAVAYLRLLGYDAKSLLYGANSILYDALKNTPAFQPYIFTTDKIKNYPYIN